MDARAVWAWVQQHTQPSNPNAPPGEEGGGRGATSVYVYGQSLGAAVAVRLASELAAAEEQDKEEEQEQEGRCEGGGKLAGQSVGVSFRKLKEGTQRCHNPHIPSISPHVPLPPAHKPKTKASSSTAPSPRSPPPPCTTPVPCPSATSSPSPISTSASPPASTSPACAAPSLWCMAKWTACFPSNWGWTCTRQRGSSGQSSAVCQSMCRRDEDE